MLADAAKGETATRERRATFLARFLEWSAGRGGVVDLENAEPREVDAALEAYGQHLYDSGAGAAELAETINAVAKAHRHLRRLLSAAWDSQRAWEYLEPGSSHSPLPAELCMAIAVVALAWGWTDFAALLLIGFQMLRICLRRARHGFLGISEESFPSIYNSCQMDRIGKTIGSVGPNLG